MSVDPVGGSIGSSQWWNKYTYVRDNPINRFDPLGMADKDKEPCEKDQPCAEGATAGQPSSAEPKDGGDAQKQELRRRIAAVIYNETGGLRAQENPRGKPDVRSRAELHNARVASGKVNLNIDASGRQIRTAPRHLDARLRHGRVYADALAAATEAIAVGGDPKGPKHYFLRVGPLTRAPSSGRLIGQHPWFVGNTPPVSSYGPFVNPLRTGDVPVSSEVYVDIYDVP